MRDLSDFFNPILVKEFRQGLRARVFVSAYMLLHLLMVVSMLTSLLADESNRPGLSAMFWLMLAIPFLCMLPFSGLNAVSEERRLQTLELIYLTRLTSRRILLGKTFSICLQMLLLLVSVIPYVVLRYYLGGVDVWFDLKLLGWMLVFGVLVTTLAVAVSATKTNNFFKWGGAVAGLFFYTWLWAIFQFFLRGGGGGSSFFTSFSEAEHVLTALMLAALFFTLFIESGCVPIAPDAENHSTPLRLLALAFAAIIVVWRPWADGVDSTLALTFLSLSLPAVVAICMYACHESMRRIPTLYLPFVRRGFIGRLFGLVFYPGWVSGVLFTLLLAFVLGSVLLYTVLEKVKASDMIQVEEMKPYILGLWLLSFTALAWPQALRLLFGRIFKSTFSFYLLAQLVGSIPFYLFWLAHGMRYEWRDVAAWFCTLFPISYLFQMLGWWEWKNQVHTTAGTISCGVWMLLLLIGLFRSWREIRSMEAEAADILDRRRQRREA